jgi:hypothetical protein
VARFRIWCPILIPCSEAKNGAALLDHIYMDAMGFGMGCCCLQLTFQACNVDEARRMYDALTPVGPILVCRFSIFLNSWRIADRC